MGDESSNQAMVASTPHQNQDELILQQQRQIEREVNAVHFQVELVKLALQLVMISCIETEVEYLLVLIIARCNGLVIILVDIHGVSIMWSVRS